MQGSVARGTKGGLISDDGGRETGGAVKWRGGLLERGVFGLEKWGLYLSLIRLSL